MKRKVIRENGTRQRALLLTLEKFLAITDIPASQRRDRGGMRVKDDAPSRQHEKQA